MLSSDELTGDVSFDHLPANSFPNNSVISAILIANVLLDRRHCSLFLSSITSFIASVLSLHLKKKQQKKKETRSQMLNKATKTKTTYTFLFGLPQRLSFSHLKRQKEKKTERPIYTAENLWHGSDKIGTRTKKIALISCLHVHFSTVQNCVTDNVLVRVKGSTPCPAYAILP